ncbi:MAG TPA: folylpolyglutamate synthase/dihydrofolate synthase family protein [Candidatus Binatia bacterium]|nr:folylpolyglutamate synthase/dihydrofolate synthase family protein [Candidatus Binatia bacterium]
MDAYSETLNWIYNLRGGIIDLRLDRMRQAMSLFGHPERQFRAFHIAGTNGKGSTAAMLHRILTLAGFRTGLYTSPHLVSFTERIRVGDQEISKDDVVALGRELNERLTTAGIALTFFELVTVMAFVYFARRRIDVGVIEVGLGGRLDATNLVRPLVSLITTIARDHEAYLGADLLSIGREKAGILKTNVPAVCGALPAEVAALIREIATQQNSRPYVIGSDFKIFLKKERRFDYKGIKRDLTDVVVALHGPHQCANAALAIAALELSGESFPVSEEAIRTGLGSVSWPGRFEILHEHPWIILDGAHNGEGINALAETLREFKQGRKIKLLFAAMEDKDWRHMLSILLPFVDELIVTRVQMDRSAAPEQMASQFSAGLPCRVVMDAASALKLLVHEAGRDEIVLAAGSLYLIGEIRPSAQELALFCGEP